MVLGGAMRMALIGIATGAVVAFAVTRVMQTLLYGVSAADPLTFGSVAVVLTVITLLASYIPAQRAVKVDPMVALRYE
jgi:ABC-type antimicrobial peptide transport system permease subunit